MKTMTDTERSPDLVPSIEPDPAESVGAWLARARASYGVEPRDMARHLGLNPTIILALEADDFVRLGAPVFVRGYLSRYSRLLNLPEAQVLERYQRQAGSGQEPPPLKVMHPRQRETRVRDLRGVLYLLVVVGVGWTAIRHINDLDPGRLLSWWPRGERASVQTPAVKAATATIQTQYPFQPTPAEATREVAPVVPVTPVAPSEPAPNAESPSTSTIVIAPPSPTVAPGLNGAIPATASAVLEETAGAPGDARSGARLMLQFSDECWVEVKDAQGKVLVNGLMKANTSQSLSGPAPFTVTLGNAPAARIALDDRPVDTAIYVPRRGTVSRFTLNP